MIVERSQTPSLRRDIVPVMLSLGKSYDKSEKSHTLVTSLPTAYSSVYKRNEGEQNASSGSALVRLRGIES